MYEIHFVCYPRSDTCSLRGRVRCVLKTFFPFQSSLRFPKLRPKSDLLLPLKSDRKDEHWQILSKTVDTNGGYAHACFHKLNIETVTF